MGNSKRNIKKLNDNFREDILDYAFAHNLKCANLHLLFYMRRVAVRTNSNRVTVNYDSKKMKLNLE